MIIVQTLLKSLRPLGFIYRFLYGGCKRIWVQRCFDWVEPNFIRGAGLGWAGQMRFMFVPIREDVACISSLSAGSSVCLVRPWAFLKISLNIWSDLRGVSGLGIQGG